MNFLRRVIPRFLWMWISQPRVLNTLVACAWLTILVAGVVSYISPPNLVETRLGTTLGTVMSFLIIIGGLLGTVGALIGIWYSWLEKTAAIFAYAGSLVFLWTILTAPYQAPYFHFFLVVSGQITLAARIALLKWFEKHPFLISEGKGNG